MNPLSSYAWRSLGAALLLAGCGAPATVLSQQDASSIAPLAEGANTAHLVAAVLGHPRAIEYSVNGVRIEPAVEIAWWDDARIEIDLQPGTYRVDATYRVRGFAPEKHLARLETPAPVEVHSGGTTYLIADLAKDWRGVPARTVTSFRIVDAETFTRMTTASKSRAGSAAPLGAAAAATSNDETGGNAVASAAAAPEETGGTADAASTTGAVTILRGTPEGVTSSTYVPSASEANTPSIVIHGNDVVPPGSEPAGEAAAAAAGAAATGSEAPSVGTQSAATSVPEAQAAAAGATSTVPEAPSVGAQSAANPAATGAAVGTAIEGTAASGATVGKGRDVVEPADPSTAQGLPSAADPPSQVLLEPGSSAPATIAMRLDSQPSGAKVLVDEHEVGKTPLEVRLDPTADHVIRFERDGCGDHVRFVSAAGWEKGRSTKLTVQMECP
ncbi:MAG TPA: PEGA domain-containing protein [Candidatus Krumholzibacteria bacterium]|nr:PEGA domain-containing protein [Candidatus Krumholzibacteria bacterium]